MTDDDPADIEVLQLVTTNLSGEGTLAGLAHVLASYLDVLIEEGFDRCDVDADWSNDDFHSKLVELRFVKNILDQVFE